MSTKKNEVRTRAMFQLRNSPGLLAMSFLDILNVVSSTVKQTRLLGQKFAALFGMGFILLSASVNQQSNEMLGKRFPMFVPKSVPRSHIFQPFLLRIARLPMSRCGRSAEPPDSQARSNRYPMKPATFS